MGHRRIEWVVEDSAPKQMSDRLDEDRRGSSAIGAIHPTMVLRMMERELGEVIADGKGAKSDFDQRWKWVERNSDRMTDEPVVEWCTRCAADPGITEVRYGHARIRTVIDWKKTQVDTHGNQR